MASILRQIDLISHTAKPNCLELPHREGLCDPKLDMRPCMINSSSCSTWKYNNKVFEQQQLTAPEKSVESILYLSKTSCWPFRDALKFVGRPIAVGMFQAEFLGMNTLYRYSA